MRKERDEDRRRQFGANAGMVARRKQEEKEKAEREALDYLRKTAYNQRIRDETYSNAHDVYPEDIEEDDANEADDDGPNQTDHDADNRSDDEEADYETEDEGEGEIRIRRNKIRRAYMPPKNTPLQQKLQQTENNTQNSLKCDVRKMWIAPDIDPLALDTTCGPDRFETENLWRFIWLPFRQFSHKVQLKNIGCIHGCEKGSHDCLLKLQGLRWRPMFWGDNIVWLLYDRVQCKCCNKYTSTIDPRFLKLMPTIVVERLPFITTAAGPGIHRSMLFLLNSLRTNQITEGVFANAVNETNRIRFDYSRVGYYDAKAETAEKDADSNFGQQTLPMPFSQFNRPGHFNGIRLTPKLLNALFNSYMVAYEPYFQASFQLESDEGIFTDHTHKFGKGIRASGRAGKVFTASYTGGGLAGAINFSVLTYTKANAELLPFMGLYRIARGNAGAGPLKTHASDHLAGDGHLMTHPSTFKEDLEQGVSRWRPANPNCVQVSVSEDR